MSQPLWMTDFSTKPEKASMTPKQTAPIPKPAETEPPETKPVETKPAETKPVVTKPAELTTPRDTYSASYLPYFLDEDSSGKYYFRFTEKLDGGGRALFRADAVRMDYILEDYVETLYGLGYRLVKTDGKDEYSTWYTREWYLANHALPDTDEGWHVYLHVMVDFDNDDTSVTIDMLGGVRMDKTVIGNDSSSGGGIDWDDDDDDNNFYGLDCVMCDGTGDCDGCGGDGYNWSFGMDREKLNCLDCNASGNCWYCSGTGKR